jgi:hypothetical protein
VKAVWVTLVNGHSLTLTGAVDEETLELDLSPATDDEVWLSTTGGSKIRASSIVEFRIVDVDEVDEVDE